MIFWYRNSILASIISVFGCAMVCVGISSIANGESDSGAIVAIVVGVIMAIIGKVISVNKAQKK